VNWLPQDIRFAFRFLRRRWGVTSVAIVVMGLGISLTASMYAIIDGVVLSGPNYTGLERILFVRTTVSQSEFHQSVRLHDYLDWKAGQQVFDEMAAYIGTSVNLSGADARAESFRGVRMTASTFALLGEQPMVGRAFTPEEDLLEHPDVVMIGHHVWEDRYGADPDIIGRSIRLNARPSTIVGVMPPSFRFPENHDMWMPLGVDPGQVTRREGPGLAVIGRLSSGATLEGAHAQLTAIAARLEQQYPEENKDIAPVTETWIDAQFVDDETKSILYTMFVAVLGVLLIACANVANLLFAVTMGRGRELAIRTSMGAERSRVLRQLLTEALMLAAGGAVLGIFLTGFALKMFTRVVTPLGVPPWMTFEVDAGVVGFVIVVTLFAALASGLLPALHATKTDVRTILQDQSRGGSSRSSNRWSNALLVLEVALSCALLVGAGLTVRSTLQVANADFGMGSRDGISTARVLLPAETYPDSIGRQAITERFRIGLESIPGVTDVAITSALPVLGTSLRFYGVGDHDYADDSEYPFSGFTSVTGSFFDVIGASLLEGRNFNSGDGLGSDRVVIVDKRFADLNWPGQDALGRQVRMGRSESENPWLTVVGVVSTVEMAQPLNFLNAPPENLFVPIDQRPVASFSVMLKAAGGLSAVAPQMRDLAARLDPDIPVNRVDTLDDRVKDASLDLVILGGMFLIFGVVALLLASIGLYAVMSFSVSRRTAEVGIRMALGADGGRVLRLIVGQGLRPVAVGIVLGLALAVLLGRALASFLYNVAPLDPVVFTGIPLLLILVSLGALLIPASRAARIAPVVALNSE